MGEPRWIEVPPSWDGDLLHVNVWQNLFLLVLFVVHSRISPWIQKVAGIDAPATTKAQLQYVKVQLYVLEIVVLTLINVLTFALPLWDAVLHPDKYVLHQMSAGTVRQLQIGFATCWNVIMILYWLEIFLLGNAMRLELKVHHWYTIVMGNLLYLAIVDDYTNLALYRLTFMLATANPAAELPTFVALLCYRIAPAWRNGPFWYSVSALWFGISRVVFFILNFIMWADYYQSIKNNTSSWGYFALAMTFIANFLAFVTGLQSLKAQVLFAKNARTAADARANEMHTRPTDADIVMTEI